MSWLAMLVLGLGVADLVGGAVTRARWAPQASGAAAMALVFGLGHLWAGPAPAAAWLALAASLACLQLWRTHAPRAELGVGHARAALGAAGATAVLVLAASGLAGPVAGPLAGWLPWLQVPGLAGRTPTTALALGAWGLFHLSSANHVVRAVLVAVGATPTRAATGASGGTPLVRPAQRLRGGRLLGPMERLLIFGLTLAGNLEAAALVIAAKGLLRFPELQAVARSETPLGQPPSTVDEVTEYFLVGSFTSWLIALGSTLLV